ncbi:helix-turn-helix domain-containing protein [Bacillus sp. FJAT-49711]|uniref:helix-turn-helix domain-containing protein n=1 Tax=Bacillus sp. FJAT-49711 TaxID=2833585 RepID=UPI001BC98A92|nr:helix-turn-helix domain-containing protein [Bacillus sp. FJAT-49711]MBS4220080.1 helix-turn-helix domain-containing protein [Bacillus sp. FJAT-49711]
MIQEHIPMREEEDYTKSYTTLEAAEIVGVSDQTIRRWSEKGKYPDAVKTGGCWRIPKKYFKISLEEARKRKAFEQHLNEFNAQYGEET